MAPSRATAKTTRSSNSASDDAAVVEQGDTALVSAKRNFSYLINPSIETNHPSRFRTRALLRSFHYIGKFIFWRLVRYAKYIAVGSLIAAIGATAFGGAITGVAWLAAPPTFGASIIAATVWWTGKWGARRLQRRWGNSTASGEVGDDRTENVASPVRRDGTWRESTGPEAVPW